MPLCFEDALFLLRDERMFLRAIFLFGNVNFVERSLYIALFFITLFFIGRKRRVTHPLASFGVQAFVAVLAKEKNSCKPIYRSKWTVAAINQSARQKLTGVFLLFAR